MALTDPAGPIVVPVASYGGRIYMLELDSSGRLKITADVVANPANLDVALSTRALEAGGNLAAILAKLPAHPWNYTDTYEDNIYVASAADTVQTLSGSTVPTGEVWVVENIFAIDWTHVPAAVRFYKYNPSTGWQIATRLSPAANIGVDLSGSWKMKAGQYIRATFAGVTIGDELGLQIIGYKMSLT